MVTGNHNGKRIHRRILTNTEEPEPQFIIAGPNISSASTAQSSTTGGSLSAKDRRNRYAMDKRSTFTFLIRSIAFAVFLFATLHTAAGSACELPQEWHGDWFQSDRAHRGPVVISRHNFSSTGRCIEKGKSNKYLIQEESYSSDEKYSCFKCMVINMKHRNVIQYKESNCDSETQDLASLCHKITGDAMLFSMFRLSALPVSCPFKGPLTFTYSRNLQECVHPVSQVDSCADDSRLLLRFQACADVTGSESFEEELVCLGSWKEGVNHYLVGKINNTHAKSDNDRYRCFIYERASHPDIPDATMMFLAQSADATCEGLISAYEGEKTMKLTKANQGSKKCKLPSWFTAHNHWHTLDYSQSYIIYHHNTSFRISNGTDAPTDPEVRGHTDLRLVCHQYSNDDKHSREHRRQHQPSRHGSGRNNWDTRGNAGINRQSGGRQSSGVGGIAGDGRLGTNGLGRNDGHMGAGGRNDEDVGGLFDGRGSTDPGSRHWGGGDDGFGGRGPNQQRTSEDGIEHRAEAVQHKRGGHHGQRHSVTIIVHVTVGCRTGYWCMRMHRRADYVVQVETGDLAYRAEEACSQHYWNPGSSIITTLVARGEQSRSCGPLGRYLVGPANLHKTTEISSADCNANNMPSYSRLNVGCTSHDTLELQTSCPVNDVTTYQCHGRWDSEGVTYVVASPTSRPSGAPRRVCFAYTAHVVGGEDMEDGVRPPLTVTLTARHDTCSPLTVNAHITLNATLTGPCAEASGIAFGSSSSTLQISETISLLLPLLTCLHLITYMTAFSSSHRQNNVKTLSIASPKFNFRS